MISEFSAIHQVIPRVVSGDAVSGHALEVQRLLRGVGVASELYVQDVAACTAGEVHPLRALRPARGVAAIYHLAIGSAIADDLLDLATRGVRLVVDHHNLTPPEFFSPWGDAVTEPLAWGRRQLAKLAFPAGLGLGDSTFNVADLSACGYRRTAVAPILLDTASFQDGDADPEVLRGLRAAKADGGADWLFVGRVAPNKAHHDLIAAFAAYRSTVDRRARLHLVGASASRAYERALRRQIAGLGLRDAVVLTGPVSADALRAHYRAADVFVGLSDHEGFCVPLLESFHHGLPVVAFDAGAVGETLGSGGVLLPDKSPAVVAAAVDRVLGDDHLRAALVAAGHRRLDELSLARTGPTFLAGLELLPLDEPPEVDVDAELADAATAAAAAVAAAERAPS